MHLKVIVGSDDDHTVLYDGSDAIVAAETFRTMVERSMCGSDEYSGQRVICVCDGEVIGELTERQAIEGRYADEGV